MIEEEAMIEEVFGTGRQICDILIRCIDGVPRPCIRDKGHSNGCNPFSNTAPKLEQE